MLRVFAVRPTLSASLSKKLFLSMESEETLANETSGRGFKIIGAGTFIPLHGINTGFDRESREEQGRRWGHVRKSLRSVF
jgi:hypothetical protein